MAGETMDYHQVDIIGDDGGTELQIAAPKLQWAVDLRMSYRACANLRCPPPAEGEVHWELRQDGRPQMVGSNLVVPSFEVYARDLALLRDVSEDGHCRTAAIGRLDLLERKYAMYRLLNQDLEDTEAETGGGDVLSARKVDTTRLSSAVDAERLVSHIRDTLESGADSVNLKQRMEDCGLTADSLTVEGLGLRPRSTSTFHRFDVFSRNAQRSRPAAKPISVLLKPFLRPGPDLRDSHFATLARPLFDDGARGANTAAEFEVVVKAAPVSQGEISGSEWVGLAEYFSHHGLSRGRDVKLSACLPRLREIDDHFGVNMGSVSEQLGRFFDPLWHATASGSGSLAALLKDTVSLGIRSEEEAGMPELSHKHPSLLPAGKPRRDDEGRTPDALYMYYFWVELCRLNEFRAAKGLNTLAFRVTACEVGNMDHLLVAFILADSVMDGSHLARSPTLSYLYYLSQVGLLQTPLAFAAQAALPLQSHPFPTFLKQGLRVTLAAVDPLHHHRTQQPLMEEYSAAATSFRLSAVDLCEAAANSLQIASWVAGKSSSVPACRRRFRHKVYVDELSALADSGRRLSSVSRQQISQFVSKGHAQTEAYLKLGRLDINGPPEEDGSALASAADKLRQLLELRTKYIWSAPIDPAASGSSKSPTSGIWEAVQDAFMKTGIMDAGVPGGTMPSIDSFVADYERVCKWSDRPDVLSLAHRRLGMLECKFGVHSSLQRLHEAGRDLFGRPVSVQDNRDFYATAKVDTHVHMAAGMTAGQLLEFIRGKMRHQSDDVIRVEKEKGLVRLRDMLAGIGVTDPALLTVDTLGVQADASVWQRFDNFNAKYSPMGQSTLRTLFLKTDTGTHLDAKDGDVMEGRYFAELCKKTFRNYPQNHYAENRISVYGRSPKEWNKLAKWFTTHGMSSMKNRWLIQVPRLYAMIRQQGMIQNFGEMLQNIFEPLWEVSLHPDRYPALDNFLRHVSGFDSVDSEATLDLTLRPVRPHEWTSKSNPPYAYWLYYTAANIRALSAFRASRGLSTFSFRPHCGETGDWRHLAAAFVCADGIAHGIQLRNNSALQYLYFLAQIPLAVSPLSNNSLFLPIESNPFPDFFRRGLYVSLSTDDPLFFHQTQEPLVEEYSICGKLWRFSSTDLCEIARNSVTMSGFLHEQKKAWIGENWFLNSSRGNDQKRTNVPDLRVAFRFETYHDELCFLDRVRQTRGFKGTLDPVPHFMRTLEEEDALVPAVAERRSQLQSKL